MRASQVFALRERPWVIRINIKINIFCRLRVWERPWVIVCYIWSIYISNIYNRYQYMSASIRFVFETSPQAKRCKPSLSFFQILLSFFHIRFRNIVCFSNTMFCFHAQFIEVEYEENRLKSFWYLSVEHSVSYKMQLNLKFCICPHHKMYLSNYPNVFVQKI